MSAQSTEGQPSDTHGAPARTASSRPASSVSSSEPLASPPNGITPQAPGASGIGLEAWKQKVQRPIEFYGKVVDELGQPVKGANVSFSCNQFIPPAGSFTTNTSSDQAGLFTLAGVMGGTLGVHVEKPGYYPVKGTNPDHFDYMQHSTSEAFSPNSQQPVVFHLRRRGAGAELITSRHGVAPDLEISGLTNGSTVRVNFFNQNISPDGQLELSATKPPRGEPVSRWSFRMSIPSGGFIEQNEEFPFEAPESGYKPMVEFDFRVGETNWSQSLHKSYYIVFGQPPRYGRIDVQTGIYRGVSLSYAINADGTRNLEPRETAASRRELPPGVSEYIPPDKR